MKTPRSSLLVVGGLFALACICNRVSGAEQSSQAAPKIRVLLVYGGHDFETNQFLKVFADNPAITFRSVVHPKAQEWFKADHASEYDVLVLYDMWQPITAETRADLISRLKEGKGLVALHHCLASYQNWDEYTKIIGGKYHLEKWKENGVEKPASTYQHDVDLKIKVMDPNHPVTLGMSDFPIRDEAYGLTEVRPGVHVLLTTDEPRNGKNVAWAHIYEHARVVYIQLGHDHQAYDDWNYRRLVRQAINWVGQRSR